MIFSALTSVADPDPGYRVDKTMDSGSASRNLSIFFPKPLIISSQK
jgi:hypothetical protein